MNSKNANNYENVVIRKEQEIGINNFGLEYLVSLEQEIERLEEQLQQKDSIIKEVREYVNKMWLAKLTPDTVSQTKFELLEILDKEE